MTANPIFPCLLPGLGLRGIHGEGLYILLKLIGKLRQVVHSHDLSSRQWDAGTNPCILQGIVMSELEVKEVPNGVELVVFQLRPDLLCYAHGVALEKIHRLQGLALQTMTEDPHVEDRIMGYDDFPLKPFGKLRPYSGEIRLVLYVPWAYAMYFYIVGCELHVRGLYQGVIAVADYPVPYVHHSYAAGGIRYDKYVQIYTELHIFTL